jgi:hypothetical protein
LKKNFKSQSQDEIRKNTSPTPEQFDQSIAILRAIEGNPKRALLTDPFGGKLTVLYVPPSEEVLSQKIEDWIRLTLKVHDAENKIEQSKIAQIKHKYVEVLLKNFLTNIQNNLQAAWSEYAKLTQGQIANELGLPVQFPSIKVEGRLRKKNMRVKGNQLIYKFEGNPGRLPKSSKKREEDEAAREADRQKLKIIIDKIVSEWAASDEVITEKVLLQRLKKENMATSRSVLQRNLQAIEQPVRAIKNRIKQKKNRLQK